MLLFVFLFSRQYGPLGIGPPSTHRTLVRTLQQRASSVVDNDKGIASLSCAVVFFRAPARTTQCDARYPPPLVHAYAASLKHLRGRFGV